MRIYALVAILCIVINSSTIDHRAYFSEYETHYQSTAQDILENETKKALAEYIAQYKNAQAQVSIKEGLALTYDEEKKTAVAIFEIPEHAESYKLSKEEIEAAKKLFKVRSIQHKGTYKVIEFRYQDANLLPENKAQALFLLYAPYEKHSHTPEVYPIDLHKSNPLNTAQTRAIYGNRHISLRQKFNEVLQKVAKNIPDHEGLLGSTVVKTDQGYRKIEDIQPGDLVACYDPVTAKQIYSRVFLTDKQHLLKHIEITTVNDEIIKVGPKHKFYAQSLNKFITAEELKNNPELQTLIGIKDIQEINEGLDVVRLGVRSNHNFYITDNDFLVHNFFMPAPIVFVIPVLTKVTVQTVVGFGTLAASIYYFFKHHQKHRQRSSVPQYTPDKVNFPMPPDPNKDKKGPHGTYKDADYHHKNSRGPKSPAPKNGQKALDNSVEIPGSSHRIGISEGQFVALYKTLEGIYHGHVRAWEVLEHYMKQALIDAGKVTKSGNII